jgi:fibronectin-binding autotransporter adhesin
MRQRNKAISAAVAAAFSSGILALGHSAMAQTADVWIAPDVSGNASGSWNSAANWSIGIPLETYYADVTEQDVSGTSTITLDGNQAIGNITFGDSNTTSSGGWVLNSTASVPSNSSDLLTLNPQGYNLFYVNQLGAGSVATINAQMTDSSAGNLELAKGGAGTLVLTGNNSTLTGAIAVNNGVLELDFDHAWSPTTNILGDDGNGDAGGQHVNFQGGELLLNGGGPGAVNSQNFSSGSALENGGSVLAFNQNQAASLSVNLGALTRNLYATIDVSLPESGTVSVGPGTGGQAYPDAALGTNNSGLDGLLVDTNGTPFATVNGGADWAIVNPSGDIMPGSSTVGFYTTSGSNSLSGNADVSGGNVMLLGNTSVSTIRFNDAAAGRTIDIGNSTNTLTTAGILMTPSAGGNETIQDGNLIGSEAGAGGDTQIGVFSTTSSLTISAVVSGATAITKTGPGTLVLSAANTYTGETVINGGTVDIPTGAVVGTPYASNFPADVQIAPAFGDTATLNVSGGTLNAARTLMAGNDNNFAGGTGTLNQTGGTINNAQWFTVGGFGNGTFNMSGGILNVNQVGYAVMEISVFGTSNGTVNLSGTGQINIYNNADMVFGSVNTSGDGTVNQTGGHVTFYSDDGVTIGGGGGVLLGGGGVGPTAVDTYNLNGGILSTPSISHAAGTAILNLNGGTLQAVENTAGFVGGLNQANVGQGGGAVVDTNGYNVTISQPLLHAASLGALTDDGLNKNGAGTLTITGVSSYTGATNVNAGTLQLPAPGVPVPVASYSFDGYTPGVLDPNTAVITNSGSGGSAMNGKVNIADWSLAGVMGEPASGATITASGTGPYGGSSKAVNFDGAGTSIDVPSQIIDQSGGANWTFSVWVQTTTPGSAIISKNVASAGADSWASGNTVYYVGNSNTTPADAAWSNTGYPTAVRFGDGFIQGTPPTTPITDGQWHMLTYVDSGGTQSIYMDNVDTNLNVTGAYGNDLSSLTRIGINIDTFFAGDGNVDFAGSMDDLNFYNVALDPTQIGELYSSNTVTSAGGGEQIVPENTPVSVTASGAIFNLNGQNQTIGSLAGIAGSSVTLGGGYLTTGGNNTNTAFAGAITGTGGIIKTGSGTFTVSGVNGYGGGTTVTAGKLLVAASGALPTGTVAITGGVLQLADNISAGTPLATSSVNMTSLSITGSGTLDIGNNRVIVDYTTGHDPIASIASWIANGFYDLAGPQIISSDIAADDAASGYSYGVGYADGADGVVAGLPSGEIEIMFTLLGDANLDGTVNGEDFSQFSSNLGASPRMWDQGDFNYDGTVNGEDFASFSHNQGQTDSLAAAAGVLELSNGLSLANVPEPASMGLLVVGGLGILSRRRRRQEVTA